MTELDSPETHIYISTRGYRECLNTLDHIYMIIHGNIHHNMMKSEY